MSLIEVGGQFPPAGHVKRLAKYYRMKAYYDGNQKEVYKRIEQILVNSPQKDQLNLLYVAVNLVSILCSKPADLLVGDAPVYESGYDDKSEEQKLLTRLVEENDLNTLLHESVTGGGYRGESFFIVRYGKRHDTSALDELGLTDYQSSEAIIEHAAADTVFPETSANNVKKFKSFYVCTIEWVKKDGKDVPYLNVARYVPGYIVYKKYRMSEYGVNSQYGFPVTIYSIDEEVETGRKENIVSTGATLPLVFHAAYNSTDDDWQGKGFVETVSHAIEALEDRISQLDYILWKHSDPVLYGPELLDNGGNSVAVGGGKYIPMRKEDPTPGAVTWDGQLDSVFKEIDFLVSYIFQMSETPQWLFGTTISGENAGGTGTSHTDNVAIKARFMPILSKVKRIRNHYDRALRDALWTCFQLEKEHGNYKGKDIYPKIQWKDGIPRNEKEEAEIMAIRTGDKPTIDQKTAIKRMDEMDDMQAEKVLAGIKEDDMRTQPVDANVFNLE